MREYNERLQDEPDYHHAYRLAHLSYLADRDGLARQLGLNVPEIVEISAGGMPDRVKCLHALVAHSLAVGTGVSLVGDEVLATLGWDRAACHC
jgi:hypothetical protein